MRRIGWFALGAWLMAWPLYAQGQKCQGSASSSASSSSTASTTSSLAPGGRITRVLNNTSTETQVTQLNSQINQLQQLRRQLITGEVTPPSSSGVSSAQAVQVVSRRITYLQNAVSQLSASSRANSSTNSALARRR